MGTALGTVHSWSEQCPGELIQSCFLRFNSFNKPHIYNNLHFIITKHIIYIIYFKNNHNRVNKRRVKYIHGSSKWRNFSWFVPLRWNNLSKCFQWTQLLFPFLLAWSLLIPIPSVARRRSGHVFDMTFMYQYFLLFS